MSRIYRIALTESTRRHVRIEDGVRTHLQILDVLPRPQLADLLRKDLISKGFEADPEGDILRVEADGIQVRVDCETGQVDVTLTADAELERAVTREVALDTDWGEEGKTRARAVIREGLEQELDDEAEAMRDALTKRLEGRLGDLRVELDKITNRVIADGLKIRAGQLGTITEVDDRLEEGSVTIKVKL